MSADLSDPNIVEKYKDITSFTSPTNWLLLSYGQSRDKLSLYASGEGGIGELRPKLQGDVFFALVREDRSFILISFVPEDISGVRRARALVHARAVGSLFKAHHAAWTITKADMLTEEAVRAKLKLPADGASSPNPSQTVPSNFPPLQYTNGRQVSGSPQQLASPPTSPNGNRKRMVSDQISLHSNSSAPTRDLPPTPTIVIPPKTGNGSSITGPRTPTSVVTPTKVPLPPSRQPSGSASYLSPTSSPTVLAYPTPRTAAQEQAAQSRAKWAIELETERRVLQRQRSRLEMQREAEAEQQALYDAERSARLKQEREDAMRAEMDEDDRRKAIEQEHARKLAAERAAEEQRRRDEVAQKKAMEAQRRREEVAARIKREREAEEERERLALEKQKEEEASLASKREIQQQFTNVRGGGSIILTGNVTTQAHDSLYWRRRYFELSSQGMAFYKSSDTLSNRLDLLPLDGKARAITEKHDELQSIPHSFAIEFHDGTMQLFCDTADDKEVLVSAILLVTKL
ncbi:hypothetical protein DL93DRAFT_2171177 [Clavulina sp. PMI_390]|nr:hypothetical protein DL93DRAFT_2171177 [Clavulina sp. PMI_390]